MRIFWLVILGLAAVAGFALWRSGNANAGNGRGASAKDAAQRVDAPPAAPTPNANLVQSGLSGRAGSASPAAALQASAPRNASPAARSDSPSKPELKPDAAALASELLASSGKADGEGDVVADALDDGSVPSAHDGAAGGDAAKPNAGVVDGKYIISGDGSAAHPYEITWDLLILASQTYQPRQGKTDIPPQVKAIDQRHIKIAGYFAFPIASTDPKELLMMLNMWDGCCVGVPPSPYDAIEVKLKEPMSNARKQFVNYGTLTGTIKVDPYVQNGWLLGMYIMEDGTIEAGM